MVIAIRVLFIRAIFEMQLFLLIRLISLSWCASRLYYVICKTSVDWVFDKEINEFTKRHRATRSTKLFSE